MNVNDRQGALDEFLRGAGRDPGRACLLAGDASNRRYLRLAAEPGLPAAVLMDAPPEKGEDVRPFVAVTHWLRERGLSAPEIAGADLEAGFLILEDLGDALYARLLEREPGRDTELYGAAVDLLVDMSGTHAPSVIGPSACRLPLPPYDVSVLAREAALVRQWWLPATGIQPSDDLAAEFDALVARTTEAVEPAREVLVLRDYHAENLIWLPERRGAARVGLLDYQDALSGHAAYDLVSLLEDARRDTSPDLREAMIRRYLERRPDLDHAEFRAAYAALGAQRNLKIVGIFARLAIRDGKPRYLALIPRVWGHLQSDLAHPDLVPLRSWVARHIPAPDPAALARAAVAAKVTQ